MSKQTATDNQGEGYIDPNTGTIYFIGNEEANLPDDNSMTGEEEFAFTGAAAAYAVVTALFVAFIIILLYIFQ